MDNFITSQTLANELGLRPQTLRRWRSEGRGPHYVRFGDTRRGRVRYARADVTTWLVTQAAPASRAPQAAPRGDGSP